MRPSSSSRCGAAALITIVMLMSAWTGASAQTDTEDAPTISLNVKTMAVQEVLKLIAEKGSLNLAIATGVAGTVTLFVEDLAIERALQLVVDMVGAAYRMDGGVVQVMTRDAYQTTYGEPYLDVRETRVFRLEHIPVQDAAAALAPLRSQTGQILQDVRSNTFVIHETPYHIDRMERVIALLDKPGDSKGFDLMSVSPAEMSERLRTYLPNTARVEPDPAGNRIIISAPVGVMQQAETLINLLDRSDPIETWTLPLDYAAPDSALVTIESMLTQDVGSVSFDARSRLLTVTDFPARLIGIASHVKKIDAPRRQVLIEARIVQVAIDDEIKTGINWEVIEANLNNLNVTGAFPALGPLEDGVRVVYGDLDAHDYTVIVEALETYGSTNLLSSPRIRVADREKANILVGSQVPYKTIDTRETPAGSLDRFEKVTIIDVGVQLQVEVEIHTDGMIEMFVRPAVSAVTAFVDNIPVVETSETSSRILVKDGNTVILGGLNKDEVRESRSGIPVLSRIPILGYLFGSTEHKTLRTELVIMLTPTIVNSEEG